MPKYLVSHTIEFEIEALSPEDAETLSFEDLITAVGEPTGPENLTIWHIDSQTIGE